MIIIIQCFNYLIGGHTIATALCVGDGYLVAKWIPINQPELNCGRNLTVDERLARLNQVRTNYFAYSQIYMDCVCVGTLNKIITILTN